MLPLWFHKHLISKVTFCGLTYYMIFEISKKIPVTYNFFFFCGLCNTFKEIMKNCFSWFSLRNHFEPLLSPFWCIHNEGMQKCTSVSFTMSESWRTAWRLVLKLYCDVATWCLSKLDQNKGHFTLRPASKLSVNIVRNFPTKLVEGNVPIYCLMIVEMIGHRWVNASEMLHCTCAVLNLLMFGVIWWCATLKEWCVLLSR